MEPVVNLLHRLEKDKKKKIKEYDEQPSMRNLLNSYGTTREKYINELNNDMIIILEKDYEKRSNREKEMIESIKNTLKKVNNKKTKNLCVESNTTNVESETITVESETINVESETTDVESNTTNVESKTTLEKLAKSYSNLSDKIYGNDCCYIFYNNCCTKNCVGVIQCINDYYSEIIFFISNIYMFIISIFLSVYISIVENKLNPNPIKINNNKIIDNKFVKIIKFEPTTPTTTTNVKNSGLLGFKTGYYKITYQEAISLKWTLIIITILICLFSIIIPLILAGIFKKYKNLKTFIYPAKYGYLIGYILINIQYHLSLAFDIIKYYNIMISIHIIAALCILNIVYQFGYYYVDNDIDY